MPERQPLPLQQPQGRQATESSSTKKPEESARPHPANGHRHGAAEAAHQQQQSKAAQCAPHRARPTQGGKH